MVAAKIEEQKNPGKETDCWNSKNQYAVLKSNPTLCSGCSSILIAHRTTLRSSFGEGYCETASRSRQV